MAFEQDAIQYVNSLCINGTFMRGDIVGINDVLENAQAKVTVLKNNEGFDKFILINRINSVFSWVYLNTIESIAENYVQWSNNTHYIIGDKIAYLGKLYTVIQSHQSQSNWTPDVVPALFTIKTVSGIATAWVQPIGASDAYLMGDQVQYKGFTWSNSIAANVWEPGSIGSESLWIKVPDIIIPTPTNTPTSTPTNIPTSTPIGTTPTKTPTPTPTTAGYPAWVQPVGAPDAYPLNTIVTHNGFTWKSLINANVWEPGGVGTESLWVKI